MYVDKNITKSNILLGIIGKKKNTLFHIQFYKGC